MPIPRRSILLSALLGSATACSADDDRKNFPYDSIQEAIDSVSDGSTVYIPPGTYVESLDIADRHVSLIGSGPLSTKLIPAQGPGIRISAGRFARHVRIKNLTIESGAKGQHLIDIPFGLSQCIFDNLRLIQKSDVHMAVRCIRSEAKGGLFDSTFANLLVKMNKTATVPGFYVKGAQNVASANIFERLRLEGGGNYMLHLEASSRSYCYNNRITSINLELCQHGGIRILGGFGTNIESVAVFDTPKIEEDVIYIGRSQGGLRSGGTSVANYQRTTGHRVGEVFDIHIPSSENWGKPRLQGILSPPSVDVTVRKVMDVAD